MARSNEALPPSLDPALVDIGYGGASQLLEHLCEDREGWVVRELVAAENEGRRLYLQAYATVIRELRARLNLHRNNIGKEPIPRVFKHG